MDVFKFTEQEFTAIISSALNEIIPVIAARITGKDCPSLPTDNLENRLKDKQAAALMGVSEWTLRQWRCNGKGPAYEKHGTTGGVRYRLGDVLDFMAAQKVTSTAAAKLR